MARVSKGSWKEDINVSDGVKSQFRYLHHVGLTSSVLPECESLSLHSSCSCFSFENICKEKLTMYVVSFWREVAICIAGTTLEGPPGGSVDPCRSLQDH